MPKRTRISGDRFFKCPECGIVICAPKLKYHMTSEGHIKTMWCFKCKEERDFEQVSRY